MRCGGKGKGWACPCGLISGIIYISYLLAEKKRRDTLLRQVKTARIL